MNDRHTRITHALQQHFNPDYLLVEDESSLHAGHAHAGVETHFHVAMQCKAFAGMSRLAMHRAVQDVLADELENGLHALRLSISS